MKTKLGNTVYFTILNPVFACPLHVISKIAAVPVVMLAVTSGNIRKQGTPYLPPPASGGKLISTSCVI
jgi:hypothetical protein